MEMSEEKKQKLLDEIILEQQISPLIPKSIFETYIDEGVLDINNISGALINYETDLQARVLLKTYVMYANHKRLHEFKEVYAGEYTQLQIKYFTAADIS